ncbi:MAG: hypothetical protein KC910_12905, partial [Candidatus Eremiobacteraeota bacterium]|nr:hypothetical protein [Candidatus Eremiobacteraeota bacterium]
LDGRDWRLEFSQSKKLRDLTRAGSPPARVDFFSSGQSLDSLRWQGRLQSLFSATGRHKLDRVRLLEAGGWQLPSWRGCRSLVSDGQGHLEAIDRPGHERPSCERLLDNLRQQMKVYPSAMQVVVVSGHGDPDRVSGLAVNQLAETLEQATEETGVPVRMFVSDACNLGNLSALAALPSSVEVAVVAQGKPILEEQLAEKDGQVMGSRVRDALDLSALAGDDPQSLARSLVEAPRSTGGLTAVDLKVLREQLLPAVAALKLENGQDLGQQLAQLGASQALEAYHDCLIAHRPSATQPELTGLGA